MFRAEEQHRRMFEAHHQMLMAADGIHAVVVAITAHGRHAEVREKFRNVLDALEETRDRLDNARRIADEARTALLKTTGCNGECRNPPENDDGH